MLRDIIANKMTELAVREAAVPLAIVRRLAEIGRPVRDFKQAIKGPGLSVIAEIKRRSPSCDNFRNDFDPLKLAEAYVNGGAKAISILADSKFFGTTSEDFRTVANSDQFALPIMWKDFILGEYQIYEARASGADAVLLIARLLDISLLRRLLAIVCELGLQALVEVFDATDVNKALEAGAQIIGVNTRDLTTFRVDRCRAAAIRRLIPSSVTTVSESGVDGHAAMAAAHSASFNAVLIGELLLKAPDPSLCLRELLCFEAFVADGSNQ